MRCPDCGTAVAETAKACPYCGRYLGVITTPKNAKSWLVKVALVLLGVILITGAAYVTLMHLQKETSGLPSHDYTAQWTPMDFADYGLKLEVPGVGWSVFYDAKSQVIFKDAVNAELDFNFLGAKTANPEAHRIINVYQDYVLESLNTISLQGVGETQHTVISLNEAIGEVYKHQLFFKYTHKDEVKGNQTFTYVITLTYPARLERDYKALFNHIIESIQLY